MGMYEGVGRRFNPDQRLKENNLIKNMSQDNLLRLKCSVCKRANYYTSKNKKKVERKLEYQKFCKWCKKRTTHKEAKMTG